MENVTAKKMYKEYTVDLPQPKITEKYSEVNFPADVWPRLSYSVLTAVPRQAIFDAIHGLTRNRSRLHQQGRAGDPWCQVCPWTVPLQPPKSDLEHIYCSCVMVRAAWLYTRSLLYQHQPQLRGSRDSDLVSYRFPQGNLDAEAVWLLATYQEMVQELCLARGVRILPLALKGRFKERLLMSRTRASEVLLVIL